MLWRLRCFAWQEVLNRRFAIVFGLLLLCALCFVLVGRPPFRLTPSAHSRADSELTYNGFVSKMEGHAPFVKLDNDSSQPRRLDTLNVCIKQRFAPELFVLGAQKAGTTFLCGGLEQRPSILTARIWKADRYWYDKENHIFDDRKRFKRGVDFWLYHFPKCQHAARRIALDCTPAYLRDDLAPERIISRYQGLQHRLYFVFLLREPLARMHSAFYHGIADGWKWYSLKHSFSQYANNIIENPEGSKATEPLMGSLYAPQIRLYFERFDSKQFLAIPFTLTLSPSGRKAIIDHIMKRLGITVDVPLEVDPKNKNTHSHPKLEDELTARTIRKVQMAMWRIGGSSKAVGNILSSSSAELYGYKGNPGNAVAMGAYIRNHW